MMIAGTVGSALAAALFADIARSPVVPGASDNLRGCAAGRAGRAAARAAGEERECCSCPWGPRKRCRGGIYGSWRGTGPSWTATARRSRTSTPLAHPKLIVTPRGEGRRSWRTSYRPFGIWSSRAARRADAPAAARHPVTCGTRRPVFIEPAPAAPPTVLCRSTGTDRWPITT